MDFVAVVDQAIALLRQRRRVTYRALQRQFQLDDAYLEALKTNSSRPTLAVDEDGRSWSGRATLAPLPCSAAPSAQHRRRSTYTPPYLAEKILTSRSALEGERKQVTVLFADLKGSMELTRRPRSRGGPAAPRSGPGAHDGRGPPLRRHRQPGAGRRHHGPVRSPLAHEDHAVRACYAALAMQARAPMPTRCTASTACRCRPAWG